jgi:ATP-dependent Clp protease protease subunit
MPSRPRFHRAQREPSENPNGWEIVIAGDLTEKQSDLIAALTEVERGSQGTIYFDSNGGSAFVGVSLAALIRLRSLDVTAVVLGECSSAALLPFAACQKRYVLPQSTLYFHPVHWSSEEDVTLEEAAEWARHFCVLEGDLDELLARMFPLDLATITSWTRPGRFMTGRQVAQAGIARLIDLLGGDLDSQIAAAEQPTEAE